VIKMSDKPLVEKFRPQKFEDLQGNNSAIKSIRTWAEHWERGDQPQLLSGPPGVGKTSTAQVVANEMGWPITEINASDARRSDEIADIVNDMKLTPIDAEHQLVLLDEVDSLSGRTNLTPLYEVLDDPPNPVMMVCNEPWDVRSGIKSRSKEHEFSLGRSSRQAKLRKIAKEEDLDIGAAKIGELSERENLRDAITDLQMMVAAGGEILEDGRTYEDSPFSALDDIRMGRGVDGLMAETPPDMLMWMDSGLRDRYRGVEAQVVWDLLARSDKWCARAGPNNDFRYWKYAGQLQQEIAEVRLTDPYGGYVNYGGPTRVYPPNAQSDNAESTLYRELQGEDGRFGMSCEFNEFRQIYLPMLLDLDVEERYQLAVEYDLSDKAQKALDIDPDDQEDWATESGEKVEEQSVFDW